MNIKSYWVLVAGFVVLLAFVVLIRMPKRYGPGGTHNSPWLGPGGTRESPWLGPGGTRESPWLGPGGEHHLYEGFAGGDTRFTMFGVDWCPHCVSAKPKFESLGPTTTIGGHAVQCRYVNPESDKAAAAGFAIDGYPTFYLEKAGQKIKYEGPRTAEGFQAFLVEQLS